MANLTAELTLPHRPRGTTSYVVANGVTVYAGSLVGTDLNGVLNKWDNVATTRFAGICQQTVVGNTGATPPVEARVNDTGVILKGVTVAGASSIATVNSPVYCQTDNVADLTVTAATSKAIGFIVRYISGSINDVQLYTSAEQNVAVNVT